MAPDFAFRHSTYDAVTPPLFARISGTIGMPRSFRIFSPPGVVGPFAASMISRARTECAFFSVITASMAPGINTSTFSPSNSSFVIASASYPASPPTRSMRSTALSMSMPESE